MSENGPSVETLEKQLRVLQRKLERSEWHRVDLENQHDRDQHLYRRLQTDLEAAQREAEIQLALERIRARAMAMRSSEELLDVMFTLRREYAGLGLECGAFWHTHYTPEVYQKALTGIDGHKVAAIMELPRDFASNPALAAWERGDEAIGVFPFGTEAACEYLRHMVTRGKFQEVDPEAITEEMVRANDGWTFVQARTSHGEIGYSLWGETEPSEEAQAVLVRFAAAFDLAYRRFLDLNQAEAQAREAQIEAALERVRGRAMAMRSSDELREMVLVILNEMKALAFPSGRCTIVLFDRETGDSDFWMSGLTDDALPERYHVPYHTLPTYQALLEGWRQGTPFFEIELAGEVKREQDRFFHEETEFSRLPEPAKEGMRRFGDIWLSNAATTHGVVQAVGPEPLSDDNAAILRRFAKVIDLTYTRVEDIQQSEAQVREAQIEAALERVRSRTIGMQRSDELPDAALTLFDQLKSLGMPAWSAGYCIWDEDKRGITAWMSSEGVLQPPFHAPLNEDPYFMGMREGYDLGVPLHVHDKGGEALEEHYAYMRTLPVVGEILDSIIEAGHPLPTYQINHCAYFTHGFLLFITYEPVPEAHPIFERFAKVFDQTYTRYLDLRQSEAQAHEAQVEAALERVRSRSLAMQTSDELGELSHELVKQVQALGVDTWHCAFHVYDEGKESSTEWGANADGFYPTYTIPRVGIFERYHAIGQSGADLHVEVIGEDRCAEHYEELCAVPGVGDVLLGLKGSGVPFPESQVDHVAFFRYGYLIFVTFEPAPEAHDIFRRFARVFEQSYTRFLDLKRAEEQAREARVETALERVRSRTMGMHKSEELKDVIRVVNDQIVDVGLYVDHAGFIIDYKNREDMHLYLADPNEVASEVTIPYFDSAHFNSFREAKRTGTQVFTNELGFEEKNAFYERLFELIPGVPDEAKEFYRQCPALSISTVLLDNVGLYVENFSGRPYTDEDNETLLRFGKVFQQAYTRFLDLQRAEEQAREAEVELALERVRARTMAMQQSTEISEVALVLYEQLQQLGAQLWGTGFAFCTPASDADEFWFVNPGGILPPVSIPHTDDAVHRAMYEGWQQGQALYSAEAGGEELAAHYAYMLTVPDVHDFFQGMLDAGLSFPTWQKWHAAYFSHGYLLIITLEPFEEEHVFPRFAKAFEQAYVRFLDLQRAEGQAREAQIEAALERVRGRAMAMHRSDELGDVAVVLFGELEALEIPMLRCGIGIVDEEADEGAGHIAVRAATEDGGAGSLRVVGSLPLRGLPHVEEMVGAWRAGAATYTYDLTGEALERHREVLVARFDMPREAIIPERQVTLACPFPAGFLFVTGNGPLSGAEAHVARRLTDVFAFAYARFEELQSAEARAHQAEQQASLDRVRAEVASMRTAADLEHVTPLVWRELIALGVPFFRCGVFIVDEATETAEAFLTTPGGEPLAALRLPFGALPTLDAAVGHWREGRGHTDEWDHQQYEAWTQALIDQGLLLPTEHAPASARPPENLALHFAPFEQGMLYVGSAEPLATDEVASVRALADAFAVAYARYEDFQRLEAKNREVEEAMDELRAAQARLVQSEKMASLGQLTAGIAHEIKNPLNFVNNFASLSQELVDELAEEADPEERAALLADLKQNAAKIEEHGRRADGIVRAMMEHARSGSGPHRPVALNTLVAEHAAHAEHAMRVRYPDFEARLDLRLADDVGEVTMEPQEIGRVLVNLVDNALDATRQCAEAGSNGYAPTVTVSTRRTEDNVEVRVADNGPGLAPEVAAKVFEPFFTTKPAGQGTGLGLSLSHDIVAQGHGGILAVESVEGEGAAFVVSLPAPRSEAGVSGRASP